MVDNNTDDMPPWLQPVNEEMEVEAPNMLGGNLKKIIIGSSVVVLILFAVSLWVLYDRPADEVDQPIDIRAPQTAIREKPTDPGGMDIPHRDKEVFKRVTGEEGTVKTALSPEAEVPVSVLPTDSTSADRDALADLAEKTNIAPASTLVAEPAATITPIAEPSAGSLALSGTHLVQVGAYGSAQGAANFWSQLTAKYPSSFKGLSSVIQTVSRDGNTLYRLRAGPFSNRVAAEQLCQSLKNQKQACLVVVK